MTLTRFLPADLPRLTRRWLDSVTNQFNRVKASVTEQTPLKWGLSALAFLLPLTFDLRMEDTFDLPKATLFHVGIMVIVWFWWRHVEREGGLSFQWMPLDAVVMARFSVAIACTIFSIHRFTSIMGNYKFYQDGLWSFTCYVVIYFLVSRCLKIEETHQVINAGLLSCSVVSIYGVLQGIGWDPFFPWSNSGWVASSMGNPNFLGAFLCLMLPLGLGRYLAGATRIEKLAWLVWFSLGLTALILTRTRSAWLGFLIGMTAFGFLAKVNIRSRWKELGLPCLATLLIAGSCFLASRSLRISVADRVAVFLDRDEGSAHARLFHWKTALEAATDHPILGSGLDTFAYVFAPHQDPASVRYGGRLMIASNAHNEVLQALATTGIIGLIVYIWFLVRWGLTAGRLLARRRGTERIWLASLISGVLGLWIHAQFNFNVLTTWFYFWILSGLLSREAHDDAPQAVKFLWLSGRVKWIFTRILVVASVVVCWISFSQYMADREMTKGMRLQNVGQWELATQKYEKAIRLNPGLYPAYFFLGSSFKVIADARRGDAAVVKRCLDQALKTFQAEVKFFPWSPSSHNNLAMAYMWRMTALKERHVSEAFREINKAIRLGPAMPDVWDHMAQMYDFLGNKNAAVQAWNQALEVMPAYYPAWEWLHKRLPEPVFNFISQSIEVDDIPVGKAVDIKKEQGKTVQISNDSEKTISLTVEIIEPQDSPLVVPTGYTGLSRPQRFLNIPRQVNLKAMSILSLPITIRFKSSWRYNDRKFFIPIYIGVSGEGISSGRFVQLLVNTRK